MWVIETNSRYCRDCYKCLKFCPVKAIKFEVSASRIVQERCILCGNCIRNCQQNAKRDLSYLPDIRQLLAGPAPVAVSIAPSFASFFNPADYKKVFSLLKKLGFSHVEETAYGAYYVAQATRAELEQADSFRIGSACPSAVYLIEKYFPEYIPHLSAAVSPAIAHARLIKQHYGEDTRIVFLSPCAAKKYEVMEEQYHGLIDFPFSFLELIDWAKEEGLSLEDMDDDFQLERNVPGFARLFPVRGGILKTADLDSGYTSTSHLSISGAQNIINFLKYFSVNHYPQLRFIDFLMCEGGCINGPLAWRDLNPINRLKVAEYQTNGESEQAIPDHPMSAFTNRVYESHKVTYPEPSEDQIKEILANIGKHSPESELNCGACGYSSCREKAVAVFQGMAEPEMCLPYMRQKAESLSNMVIDNTPNGVVIVDRNLRILTANPSFRQHFGLQGVEFPLTRPLEKVLGDHEILNRAFDFNRICIEKHHFVDMKKWFIVSTFPIPEQGVIVGLFQDQTGDEEQRAEIEKVRGEIANRTHDVIHKQMRVAQEIASLLGETTAETKAMLTKLARILKSGE
jgi:iron only hydrogenase large subunit-like protein/uncharacterized Fe-S cluster-containing protein